MTVRINVRAGLGRFNCKPEGFDRVFYANSVSVLTSEFFRRMVCASLGVSAVEFRF